jgi:hypothetical protein
VSATFTFETLKDQGVISGGSSLTLVFVLVVCFSGACLFQVFISYRLVQSPS